MDEDKLESPEFYVKRIGDCCRMMCSPLFESDRNSGGTPSSEFSLCAAHLCYCCECVLCHGLKETTGSFFYAGKPRLIDILGAVPGSMPKTERAAGAIMLNEAKMRAKTATGKARTLIRELLNKGSFTEWLSTLNMSTALLGRYYEPHALVANYDHVETISRQIDELTKLVYLSYSLADTDIGADDYWKLHADVTCYVPRSELASVTIMALLSDDNPQLLQVQAIFTARRQQRWLRDLVPRAVVHAEALMRAGPSGVAHISAVRRGAVHTCGLLRAKGVGVDLPALAGAVSACGALLRARAGERNLHAALVPSAVAAEALVRGVCAAAPLRRLRAAAAEAQALVRGDALYRRHGAEVAQGLLRERLLRYERAAAAVQGLVRTTLLAHERAAEAAQGLLRASAVPDVCGAIATAYGLLSAGRERQAQEARTRAARESGGLLLGRAAAAGHSGLCAAVRDAQAMLRCAAESALYAEGIADGAVPAQAMLRGHLARRGFAELLGAAQAAQGLVRRGRTEATVLSASEAAAAASVVQGLLATRALRAEYVHGMAVCAAQGMVAAALRSAEFRTAYATTTAQSAIRERRDARTYRECAATLAAQGLLRGAQAQAAHGLRCAAAREAAGLAAAAAKGKGLAGRRAAAAEMAGLRKSRRAEREFRATIAAAAECQGMVRRRYFGGPDLGGLAEACVMVQGYVRDGIAQRRREEAKKKKLLELEEKKAPKRKSAEGKSESFGGKTVSIMDDYTADKETAKAVEPMYEAPISRPNWVPDDQSEDCCLCRSCGNLVCAKCTMFMELPNLGYTEKVRVCKSCKIRLYMTIRKF